MYKWVHMHESASPAGWSLALLIVFRFMPICDNLCVAHRCWTPFALCGTALPRRGPKWAWTVQIQIQTALTQLWGWTWVWTHHHTPLQCLPAQPVRVVFPVWAQLPTPASMASKPGKGSTVCCSYIAFVVPPPLPNIKEKTLHVSPRGSCTKIYILYKMFSNNYIISLLLRLGYV